MKTLEEIEQLSAEELEQKATESPAAATTRVSRISRSDGLCRVLLIASP